MIYQLVNLDSATETQVIKKIDSNNNIYFIPISEANTDYQEYLEWLAEGNEPEVIND